MEQNDNLLLYSEDMSFGFRVSGFRLKARRHPDRSGPCSGGCKVVAWQGAARKKDCNLEIFLCRARARVWIEDHKSLIGDCLSRAKSEMGVIMCNPCHGSGL